MARRSKPEEERTRDWLNFRWTVPEAGFEWVDGAGGPWLRPQRSGRIVTYDPFADPDRGALLRDLADVEPNRRSVLAFANRYGFLGAPQKITSPKPLGESLRLWERATGQIRAVVELVEAARVNDRGRLSKWITYPTKSVAQFIRTDLMDPEQMVDAGVDPVWIATYRIEPARPEKLPALALHFAQQWINGQLARHTAPRVVETDNGELMLVIRPAHLLGAAWVQLAQWMTGESTTRYRRCAGCNRWLAIGPGVGRADRTVCGDTCRKRVQRAQ